MAVAYTGSFAPSPGTKLFDIDLANEQPATQNPPNNGTLNDVGALGIDATAVNGFEIVGPDTALAVLSTASAPERSTRSISRAVARCPSAT